jgi:phosphoglycerate dehydrogenase-like enzyme
MSRPNPRLLITAALWNQPGPHQTRLHELGFEHHVVLHDIADEHVLLDLLRDFRPRLVIAGDERWGNKAFSTAAPELLALSRHGTGTDNVDKAAAAEFGVGVINTPGTTVTPVSELVLAHILAAKRQLYAANASLQTGNWKRIPGTELRGSAVGLLGAGRIARATAKLLSAFGANVTLCSRTMNDDVNLFIRTADAVWQVAPDERYGRVRWEKIATRPALLALLPKFDIVVTLLPLTPETTGMIDREFLAACKQGAILGSMARGGHIAQEWDVVRALEDKHLGFFFADVFRNEPISTRVDSPFLGRTDTAVSAHVGWLTDANIGRQLGGALENVAAAWNGTKAPYEWLVPLPARNWPFRPES